MHMCVCMCAGACVLVYMQGVIGGLRVCRPDGGEGRSMGQRSVSYCFCRQEAIVRRTDTADPDPAEVPKLLHTFFGRLDLLFMEGYIVNMEHSFTAQIMRFLRSPSVILIKKYAVLFARPEASQSDAILEPLERMREICKNVKACLQASMPESSWQVQFSAFWLPSPIGPTQPGRPASQALVRSRFRNIFQWLP